IPRLRGAPGGIGGSHLRFRRGGCGPRGGRTIWRSAGSAGRIVGVRHSGCGGGFETGSGRRSGIDYPLGYAARHGAVRLLVSPRKMDDPGSVRQRLQPERIRRAGGSGGGGQGRHPVVFSHTLMQRIKRKLLSFVWMYPMSESGMKPLRILLPVMLVATASLVAGPGRLPPSAAAA